MERADLLEANGGIFKPQGEAINAGAADDVKVLVVGNPANTNCLIAMSNAPDVPRERFTAMMRLDHNRAIAPARQQARQAGHRRHQDDRLGQPLADPVPGPGQRQGRRRAAPGTRSTTRPGSPTSSSRRVAKRGAAIIEARGASSAASAANAAIDHVHDWVLGTPDGDWVSMGGPVRRLLRHRRGHRSAASRAPAAAASGRSSQGLEVDDFSRERIDASVVELQEERDAVSQLGLI